MASKKSINKFIDAVVSLDVIDKSYTYRPALGEYSLEKDLRGRIEFLIDMFSVDKAALLDIPTYVLDFITGAIEQMLKYIDQHSVLPDPEFLRQRDDILIKLDPIISDLKRHEPLFINRIIEDALLEDLDKKKEEYDEIIDSQLADVEKIRDSAAGVAFQQAQTDFSAGAASNKFKAIMWGGLATVFIIVFIVFVISLMGFSQDTTVETQELRLVGLDTSIVNQDSLMKLQPKAKMSQEYSTESQLKGKTGVEIFYFATIRITLFFALAAIISFCLKILRANLHLMERNAHKGRLANNLEPLVKSAPKNQQESIRSILIQEIASFGKTGLLQKEDDSILIVKNLIDTMAKLKQGSS